MEALAYARIETNRISIMLSEIYCKYFRIELSRLPKQTFSGAGFAIHMFAPLCTANLRSIYLHTAKIAES